MTELLATRTELAHRDRGEGAYFEVPTEADLGLHVHYHPFAYSDFSTGHYENRRLAA